MPHNQEKKGNSLTKAEKRAFFATAHDGTRPNSGNGSDSSDSNKRSSGDDSKIGKTPTSTTTGTGTSDTMTSQVKSNFLPSSYKIRWCRTQRETGYCPYEVKCMFAHTKAELRTRFQNVEDGITTEEAIREILRERVRAHRLALKRAAAEDASKSEHTDKQPDSTNNKKSGSDDDSSSIGSLDLGQLANCDAEDADDADDEVNKRELLAMAERRRQQQANNQKQSTKGKNKPKYYLDPDLPLGPKSNSKSSRGSTLNTGTGSQPVSVRVGSGLGLPPLKSTKKTPPPGTDSTSSPGVEGNGSGNGVSGNGNSGNGNSGNGNSGTSNSSSGKHVFTPSSEPAKGNETSARTAPPALGEVSDFGTGGLVPMMYAPPQQQQYMPVMMVPTAMMPANQQPIMAPTAAAGQAATPQGFVPIGVPQPYFFAGGAPPQPTETMYPRAAVYGTAAGAAASQPMYIQPMPPGQPMPGMYSFAPIQNPQ